MWIPKWYWEIMERKQNDLERRVNRLENMLLQDAQNKITSLSDKNAGKGYMNGYLTIEERIKKNY